MKKTDLHENLCKYYEFMAGTIPNREVFVDSLRETVSSDELVIFFMIPFTGHIALDKLESRAEKKGITKDNLHKALSRMAREGIIRAYHSSGRSVVDRGNPVYMTEQQVRKQEDTPQRTSYARLMNSVIEGELGSVPNKTPYYRTLAVEGALTTAPLTRKVVVNISVPDPRAVLPLDVVSKMAAQQSLMGVAECYCRKTKKVLGKECEHPLETCLVFNEVAESLIDAGIARKINLDETLRILTESEEKGLVHNVDNATGHLHSICNCCPHSCILLKTLSRGFTNTVAASRFMSWVDPAKCTSAGTCAKVCPVEAIQVREGKAFSDQLKCIGCGQCVSHCPSGAIKLVHRSKYAKMYPTVWSLWSRIGNEAIIGITLNKIMGKK
jgi:Fe-S-cluster-containing hydrogenase component 2